MDTVLAFELDVFEVHAATITLRNQTNSVTSITSIGAAWTSSFLCESLY